MMIVTIEVHNVMNNPLLIAHVHSTIMQVALLSQLRLRVPWIYPIDFVSWTGLPKSVLHVTSPVGGTSTVPDMPSRREQRSWNTSRLRDSRGTSSSPGNSVSHRRRITRPLALPLKKAGTLQPPARNTFDQEAGPYLGHGL